jgi:hypothetical protein
MALNLPDFSGEDAQDILRAIGRTGAAFMALVRRRAQARHNHYINSELQCRYGEK